MEDQVDRPASLGPWVLSNALWYNVTGATLVIAKLDRLSRNAAFLLALRDSGVRFAAVDLPEANDLTAGVMALIALQKRESISGRTREALSVASSRGVRLGNPTGQRRSDGPARVVCRSGRPSRATTTGTRAALAPVVADIPASGATTLAALPEELTACGMLTQRGARWHVSTVMNLLGRLGLWEAA